MADLAEACRNAGHDSRQLRPIAHATDTGRVAVYIGAAWQELPLGKALNLHDQLGRAIAELHAKAEHPAPETFAVQLQQFRESRGIAALSITNAGAAELERRALETIAAEVPHA